MPFLVLIFFLCALAQSETVDTLRFLKLDSIPFWNDSLETDSIRLPVIHSNQLRWQGSKTVSLKADQNFLLNQELHLQISGPLDSNWNLDAQLHETDFPLQEEGTQVALQDIDYIFFEARSQTQMWRLGHSQFTPHYNKIWEEPFSFLGIHWAYTGKKNETQLGLGTSLNQSKTAHFKGIQGVQSGYLLNEPSKPVEPYSDRILLNGNPLRRDIDYKIEYATGTLSFMPSTIIRQDDFIEAHFLELEPAPTENQYFGSQTSRWGAFHVTTFAHALTKEATKANGSPLNSRQQSLIESNISIDSLPIDTLLTFSNLASSEYYWLQDGIYISPLDENPPPEASLVSQTFFQSETGSYERVYYYDSTGSTILYYRYNPLASPAYAPGTLLKKAKEEYNLGYAIGYDQNANSYWRFQHQYQIAQDTSFQNENRLGHRVLGQGSTPLTSVFFWKTQVLYQDSLQFKGQKLLSLSKWSEQWELPSSTYDASPFVYQKQSFELLGFKTKQSLDYQFVKILHSEYNTHQFEYRLEKDFSISNNSLQGDYLYMEGPLRAHKVEARMATQIKSYAFNPYSHMFLSHKWMDSSSLKKPEHLVYQTRSGIKTEWGALEQDLYAEQHNEYRSLGSTLEDSLLSTNYCLEGTFSPSPLHSNHWNLSYNQQKVKAQEFSSYFLALANRTFENANGSWKEEWNFNQSKGTQSLLRKKYEAVPQGTGDVLFDPRTGTFIEGVDHGNYRFVGMERDTLSPSVNNREMDFLMHLDFSPALFQEKPHGLFRDLRQGLFYTWTSTDTLSQIWVLPFQWSLKETLRYNRFFRTQSTWNLFQSNHTLQWTQSWREGIDNSYQLVAYREDLQRIDYFYRSRIFSLNPYAQWSANEQSVLKNWDHILWGTENLVHLPYDFLWGHGIAYHQYRGDPLATTSYFEQWNFKTNVLWQKQNWKAGIYYTANLNPDPTDTAPWSWTRGFEKGWGHQIKESIDWQWEESFYLNFTHTATLFGPREDWQQKLEATAKGVF